MPAWLITLMPEVVGKALGLAEGWQERKTEIVKAKHEATVERIKQTGDSWKDEYVLVISSYPLISLFIPALREHTIESLDYLKLLPGWMIGLWVGIAAAVYGIQKIPTIKRN